MRAGCGLAVRGNVSGNRAQSVRARRARARTFTPSPFAGARPRHKSIQMDLPSCAGLSAGSVPLLRAMRATRQSYSKLQALALRILQDACTLAVGSSAAAIRLMCLSAARALGSRRARASPRGGSSQSHSA